MGQNVFLWILQPITEVLNNSHYGNSHLQMRQNPVTVAEHSGLTWCMPLTGPMATFTTGIMQILWRPGLTSDWFPIFEPSSKSVLPVAWIAGRQTIRFLFLIHRQYLGKSKICIHVLNPTVDFCTDEKQLVINACPGQHEMPIELTSHSRWRHPRTDMG